MTDPIALAISVGGAIALLIFGIFLCRPDHESSDASPAAERPSSSEGPQSQVELVQDEFPRLSAALSTVGRGFLLGLGLAAAFVVVNLAMTLIGLGFLGATR